MRFYGPVRKRWEQIESLCIAWLPSFADGEEEEEDDDEVNLLEQTIHWIVDPEELRIDLQLARDGNENVAGTVIDPDTLDGMSYLRRGITASVPPLLFFTEPGIHAMGGANTLPRSRAALLFPHPGALRTIDF